MDRKWLVKIREEYSFTQEKVAKLAEIKRAYYTQIENGTRTPSVTVAKRIAKALNFDWTIFFENNCGEGRQKPSKSKENKAG